MGFFLKFRIQLHIVTTNFFSKNKKGKNMFTCLIILVYIRIFWTLHVYFLMTYACFKMTSYIKLWTTLWNLCIISMFFLQSLRCKVHYAFYRLVLFLRELCSVVSVWLYFGVKLLFCFLIVWKSIRLPLIWMMH